MGILKNRTASFVALILSGTLFSSANAAELSVPVTFTSGSTLTASDLNSSISAVETAVNDNNSRITAVESMALPVSMGFSAVPEVSEVTLTNLKVNGGSITGAVAPGSMVELSGDYSLTAPPSCPGCLVQIRVGFVGQPEAKCFHDGSANPAGGAPTTGSASVMLTAPSTAGVHILSFDRKLEFSCIENTAVNGSAGDIGFATVTSN